ncbi:MAG TPA: transglycosylase SLT domain-containing protein [Gemmatimonadales bacterium]|nr:transglycosylase SLT domain-containing protein [Gemmatimonadales bacterium]
MKAPTRRKPAKRERTEQKVWRGALLLTGALAIGALGGWFKRVRATQDKTVTLSDPSRLARQFGSLSDEVAAARGEAAMVRVQLDRANAVMDYSTKYEIPADLSAAIYDIALSEGIDPSLGFQLVKIESDFKRTARSPVGALGYTQLQLATARFYDSGITEQRLLDRDINLRIGFRFLKDLMGQFGNDMHLALLAYNRGPAKVAEILADGGDPKNGYSDAVLKGYRPPHTVAASPAGGGLR